MQPALEMPTMIPRWGRVVAQPNEFLIQIRGGKVIAAGQGIGCFKWPSDSIAIVPTTIAKLSFVADQVTLEKVGVQVSGLAVYRVAEPLLAYRMIDFEASRGASGLAEILRDMFVGATRRIVAGLTLEECLTHRKERVAAELMSEIAPVLAGEGTIGDATSQGWGVILDTIEIQDVRVLSEEVFARLQASYRGKLQLEALRAREEVAREEARLETEMQAHRDRICEQQLAAELARAQAAAEAERERQAIELETRRALAEVDAQIVRLKREAMTDLSPARLEEILVTETMPKLAREMRGAFERVTVVQASEAAPGQQLVGLVASSIAEIAAAARPRRAG